MLKYVRILVIAWPIVAALGCQRPTDVPTSSSSVQSEHDANGLLISVPQVAQIEPVVGNNDDPPRHSSVKQDYIRPFPVVMYDSKHQDALAPYAKRVADLIGIKTVQASSKNPVCCVWLELTGWRPNPGTPGYIIVHQPGGSIIQASEEGQMRLAIEAFESTMKRQDDFVEVPNGILTNYQVNTQPKDTKQGEGTDSR